jgi:nicotinamidase-related amidase
MLIDRSRSRMLLVDMQTGLVPAMAAGEDATKACAVLLQAAQAVAVPIVVSEQYPKGLGRTVPELARLAEAGRFFEKVEFSCQANSELQAALMADGRSQIVVAGIEAHVCVLQTALDLRAAGYEVFVVADAISSRQADSRTVAIQRMAGSGIDIVTTEMVLFEWLRTAAAAEFKALSRLIR